MKPKGLILLFLLACSFIQGRSAIVPAADDPDKMIVDALSAGNAKDLSLYFNDMIDLGIAGTEGTYSKVQATRILEDFFSKNAIQSVKINRKGNSADGSVFSLGEMQAGGKHYRLYYLLKNVNGKDLIHLFQIEETK